MKRLLLSTLAIFILGVSITSCEDDDAPAVVPSAGTITGGPFNFFVDGVADMVSGIGITGERVGTNSSWLITDAENNILGLPATIEDLEGVNFDAAGAGVCLIWYIRYEDGLTGLAQGENTTDLVGSYDISNPIVVKRTRIGIEGGLVSLAGGATEAKGVAGTDQLVFNGVTTTSSATDASYWYIITDENDDILGWVNPEDRTNAMVSVSGAPAGTCHIWGWSYRGLGDPVVGDNISTLNDDEFEQISDNFITVYREVPDGGMVSLLSGGTSAAGVTGSDQLVIEGVTTDSEADFLSYWYIITDDSDNILGFVPSNDTRRDATIDISGAGDGTCRIWGWSYRGLSDPVIGANISTLNDDPQEAISDNYITVYRQTPDGGTVSLEGGVTSTAGVTGTDQLVISGISTTSEANFLSYWYIVTDDKDLILAFVPANDMRNNATVDISGAPDGTCRIWGWSYRGLSDPVVGNHITTLSDDPREAISDNFITVYRQTPDGGTVTLADGVTTMVTGAAGTNEVVLTGVKTTSEANFLSYWYIVTDDQDNILDFVPSNTTRNNATVDLSAAPAGTCRVWGWSYRGLGDPVIGANISTLDDDVRETISDNFITVVRQ